MRKGTKTEYSKQFKSGKVKILKRKIIIRKEPTSSNEIAELHKLRTALAVRRRLKILKSEYEKVRVDLWDLPYSMEMNALVWNVHIRLRRLTGNKTDKPMNSDPAFWSFLEVFQTLRQLKKADELPAIKKKKPTDTTHAHGLTKK